MFTFAKKNGIIGCVFILIKYMFKKVLFVLVGSKFINFVIDIYRRKDKQTDISSDSEVKNADMLMECFKEKWLPNQSAYRSDDKIIFYEWLHNNYMINLNGYINNKEKHFKNAHKGERYKAISSGAHNTAVTLSCFVTFVYSLFGVNNFWIFIKSNINSIFIPTWLCLLFFVLAVVVMFFSLIYIFWVLFKIERIKRIAKIDNRKETWLRHCEVLQNYQIEIISYLTDTGSI